MPPVHNAQLQFLRTQTQNQTQSNRQQKQPAANMASKKTKTSKTAPRFAAPNFRPDWLHAGLFSTASAKVVNAYFRYTAAHDRETGAYKWSQINFAADKEGSTFARYNVGELKINMLTWDTHISDRWRHYIDHTGTWYCGKKTRGKAYRKACLKAICLDWSYVDPYPDGLTRGALAPPVNVIFAPEGVMGVFITNPGGASRGLGEEDDESCFPGTAITLTNAFIKKNCHKKLRMSTERVIKDFINGKLSASMPATAGQAASILQIEAAFFELGLRINLEAAKKASAQVRDNDNGFTGCVLETKVWDKNRPFALPNCDVANFEKMMATLLAKSKEKQRRNRRDTPFEDLLVRSGGSVAPEPAVASAPITYTANTCFPGTSIFSEPSGIKLRAYLEVSNSATEVISRFLTGQLHASIIRQGYNSSSLAQIESAFYKKGFRINTKAALAASTAVKNGLVEQIVDAEEWQANAPVKLFPNQHNDVDGMLRGLEPLFCYDSDDSDGSEDDNGTSAARRRMEEAAARQMEARQAALKRKRDEDESRPRECQWNCLNNEFTDGICHCTPQSSAQSSTNSETTGSPHPVVKRGCYTAGRRKRSRIATPTSSVGDGSEQSPTVAE